jgi:RNA polymerase sigma-70 factor (ECF subfamily)
MDTLGEMAVQQPIGTGIPIGVGDDEDARLWTAVLAGDDSAFDVLVSRHCGCIASVTSRLLRDPNDVEDVVQETFVRAYASRHRYPSRHSVRAWLLRIAINLCKSRKRTTWWRRVWLMGDFWTEPIGPDNPAALAEEALLRREVGEAV